MNILVTGSNSPLGSYLIRKLTNTFNDYEVFALSRGKYGPSLNNVKYFTHDLKKDTFSVNQSFDIVMHVASAVPAFTTNQKDFTLANLEGSKRLFENLTLNENATVLNISSTSVYDDPLSEILSEDSKKTSTNFYGISKLEFEKAIINMFSHTSIRVLTCRLPVVLVEGVKNNFIANWLKQVEMGGPVRLFNPDSLFNACISGKDIFNFFMHFKETLSNKSLICNLSSKTPMKVIEVAKLFVNSLDKSIRIVEEEASEKAQLVSNDLAIKNGFKPQKVKSCIASFIKGEV